MSFAQKSGLSSKNKALAEIRVLAESGGGDSHPESTRVSPYFSGSNP